jgi:hypothetical protein
MLGDVLESRSRNYEVVAVGGSALVLLGYVNRATRDVDLVAFVERGGLVVPSPLPAPFVAAVADVANALGLARDWLNMGPASVLELGLPEGFMDRLEARRYGGLLLQLAGRRDLIALKLYAAVDQGPTSRHTTDLQALEPTHEELLLAAKWTRTHDPSEGFRSQLVQALAFFGVDEHGEI